MRSLVANYWLSLYSNVQLPYHKAQINHISELALIKSVIRFCQIIVLIDTVFVYFLDNDYYFFHMIKLTSITSHVINSNVKGFQSINNWLHLD